jgi:hypothetical protein
MTEGSNFMRMVVLVPAAPPAQPPPPPPPPPRWLPPLLGSSTRWADTLGAAGRGGRGFGGGE